MKLTTEQIAIVNSDGNIKLMPLQVRVKQQL